MIKEKYVKTQKEISVNVVQTEIESIRKKNITKTGLRIYDNGYIGVAGAVGNVDEKDLEKRAMENLKLQIPYPYEPSTNYVEKQDYRKEIFSDEEFVKEMEELLAILRNEFPDFIFSNSSCIQEMNVSLSNDKGLDLEHKDRAVMVGFIIKEKSSVNIFDAFATYTDREYSREKILSIIRDTLNAYKKPVKLPKEGKLPVVFFEEEKLPLKKITEELNGYNVGTGASLFKDFIGQKKFSDKFTLYQSAEKDDLTEFPFFDAEGVINEGYKYALIENGKIITPYTDKKTASQFNLPLTGSATAEYDKVPSLSARHLKVAPSNKTLKELLNGQLAVAVLIATGGDFTAEGVFGTPVQLAFLTDGEKLLGRLPELTLSGELYKMFGNDFIGLSNDKAFVGQRALALNLDVKYI